MAFDLATAKPVSGGFDLSTAKPVQGMAESAPPEPRFVDKALSAVRMLTPAGVLSSVATPEGRKDLLNNVAGGIRGAGSIGATLLYPIDKANDLIAGDRGPSVTGLVTGKQPISRNQERREAMDTVLADLGADTSSGMYKAGKLATEVGGTSGVGGATANLLARIPAVASAAPGLINAIRTGGAAAGEGGNALANLATRAAGGAVSGGLSAGLVDPSQAKTGAIVGGAAPLVTSAIGQAGNALGRFARGPEQPQELANAITAARESGYVIPPSQANPNALNRTLEGIGGKLTTAQNASAKNQAVTNAKAASALGLPEDTTITPEVLDSVRSEAGKAYKAVSELGALDATRAKLPASVKTTETAADNIMGRPKSVSVDASEVVRAWRQANADATAYFRQYARDANPETLAKAKAAAGDAKQIDSFLVSSVEQAQKDAPGKLIADLAAGRVDQPTFLRQALSIGQQGDLAQNLKDAKVLIAKTHSVEGAMNAATGTIDAKKLAAQLQKGKPLSGDLKDIAEFAGRFPAAAKTTEQMGSLPQTSPLDWALALHGGKLLDLASLGARPLARSALLSGPVQSRLVQQPASINALQALSEPEIAQLPSLVAPSALSAR